MLVWILSCMIPTIVNGNPSTRMVLPIGIFVFEDLLGDFCPEDQHPPLLGDVHGIQETPAGGRIHPAHFLEVADPPLRMSPWWSIFCM